MGAAVDTRRISLYAKQCRYVLTGIWDDSRSGWGAMHGEEWPWHQDTDPDWVEGGRSNKILNANRQKKSRLMTGDVEPDSGGCTKFTSAARKGWFKERWKGIGHGNPWRPHVFRYFDAYDLYGTGAIYGGLSQNQETGKNCADAKFVHMQNVLYDRTAVDPSTSPWVAVRHILPVWEAEAFLRKEGIDPKKARENQEHVESAGFAVSLPVCTIIEFCSKAVWGCEPCRMLWIKSFKGEPLKRQRNPLGNRLPLKFMVNNLLPGARYPAGLVYTALKTQSVINEIERGIVNRMRQPGITIWNDSKLNQQDISNYFKGENGGNIRLAAGNADENIDNLLRRESGVSLSNAEIEALQHFEGQFGQDVALSEIDQNAMLQSQRTLGEINQMQAAGASNRAFDDQNVKEGLIAFCQLMFDTAKGCQPPDGKPYRYGDDDPVEVTVTLPDQSKRQMTVNADEDSSCRELMDGAGEVTIDVSALSASDATTKSNNRLMELERIAAEINATPQGQMKYGDRLIKEFLTCIGEDADDWAQASDAMMAMGAGMSPQGMPMTPLPNGALPVPA